MLKVSILIPLYNSEKYISEAIQSCLKQTYKNIEIIIVDDGSTDNSFNIAKTFESDNIIVVKQENKGACVARNKAFELSSGEYIQYLDADDILDKNKILEQIKFVDRKNINVLFSGKWDRFYNKISESIFPVRKNYNSYENPTDWFVETWGNYEMAQTSVWLTHRSSVQRSGGWNQSLSVNQDGEFFSRIILLSKSIKFVAKSKSYYRSGLQNSISNSNNEEKKALSLYKSFKLYEKNILPIRNDEEMKRVLALNYVNFIYRFHPKYPELIKKCRDHIVSLGFEKIKPNSGRIFKLIMKIIGFNNTLFIRGLLNNMKK